MRLILNIMMFNSLMIYSLGAKAHEFECDRGYLTESEVIKAVKEESRVELSNKQIVNRAIEYISNNCSPEIEVSKAKQIINECLINL